jgi:hypothetical protein
VWELARDAERLAGFEDKPLVLTKTRTLKTEGCGTRGKEMLAEGRTSSPHGHCIVEDLAIVRLVHGDDVIRAELAAGGFAGQLA